MKKHLGMIVGVILALVVGLGVLAWDGSRRDQSAFHRSQMLFSECYETRRAVTGAPVTQEFPECDRHHDAYDLGRSARMTSAALAGAGAAALFALLYFGGRRLRRSRRAAE